MLLVEAPGIRRAQVNVLTVVALASVPGLRAYNASKAAAWSMTQSPRAEADHKAVERQFASM